VVWEFWKEICDKMGMTRSLTTPYHPQANGKIEVLNQSLEISLQAYVEPSRDDWASYLDVLVLLYNSTPHTATGYAPAYLLQGYTPITTSTILHSLDSIDGHKRNSGSIYATQGGGGPAQAYPTFWRENLIN